MSRLLGVVCLAAALALGGCRAGDGPPPIDPHAACAKCGMTASDLHLACEARAGRAWHTYDSIECALRDTRVTAVAELYLADYDAQTLHRADSMWVVRGHFPTPMGGGYAAFATRQGADDLAAETHGTVDRVGAFVAQERTAPR